MRSGAAFYASPSSFARLAYTAVNTSRSRWISDEGRPAGSADRCPATAAAAAGTMPPERPGISSGTKTCRARQADRCKHIRSFPPCASLVRKTAGRAEQRQDPPFPDTAAHKTAAARQDRPVQSAAPCERVLRRYDQVKGVVQDGGALDLRLQRPKGQIEAASASLQSISWGLRDTGRVSTANSYPGSAACSRAIRMG